MQLTDPKIDERPEQPYLGLRTQTTMQTLGQAIPAGLDELFGWLGQQGIAPAGAPLLRYYVIDMDGQLDVELGVPVASSVAGNGRLAPNVLPAGRYASLVYTGIENGVAGNAVLLGWGAQQGLRWDQRSTHKGDAFGARYETFLHGPEDDPDPANWDSAVAIRLADE